MKNKIALSFEKQSQMFKVLTHPVRLAILEILRDGEHCVCHMEAHLGYRQSYISQQLSVLREFDLVQDRRDGWNIYYRVIDNRIYEVIDAMYRMTAVEKPHIDIAATCECPTCSIHAGF